jgi:hypothetical protein
MDFMRMTKKVVSKLDRKHLLIPSQSPAGGCSVPVKQEVLTQNKSETPGRRNARYQG